MVGTTLSWLAEGDEMSVECDRIYSEYEMLREELDPQINLLELQIRNLHRAPAFCEFVWLVT